MRPLTLWFYLVPAPTFKPDPLPRPCLYCSRTWTVIFAALRPLRTLPQRHKDTPKASVPSPVWSASSYLETCLSAFVICIYLYRLPSPTALPYRAKAPSTPHCLIAQCPEMCSCPSLGASPTFLYHSSASLPFPFINIVTILEHLPSRASGRSHGHATLLGGSLFRIPLLQPSRRWRHRRRESAQGNTPAKREKQGQNPGTVAPGPQL